MARSTISQTLPGTEAWFVFYGFCSFVLLGLLPLLGLFVLVNQGFIILEPSNPLSKLILFLILNYCLFGFWMLFVKLKEYWEESFITHQRSRYNAKAPQQPITFELHIPTNFQYNPSTLVPFFFFMGNTFKSTNVTKQAQLNYGRWFANVAFDFIIHGGVVKSYITVPKKKYNETIEMFKRFFPEILLEIVEDPYREYPKTWEESTGNGNYKELIGFNIGNSESNIFPMHYSNDLSVQNMPMDMMIRALRDLLPDQKIILQQIFRFNPNNAIILDKNTEKQFDEYRQSLFDKYAPISSKGYKDSHSFGALLPKTIIPNIDNVSKHIEVAYVGF
jgi:hypothetical protein